MRTSISAAGRERDTDFWVLQSKWWIREEKRVYFEVQCQDGSLMIDLSAGRGLGAVASVGLKGDNGSAS